MKITPTWSAVGGIRREGTRKVNACEIDSREILAVSSYGIHKALTLSGRMGTEFVSHRIGSSKLVQPEYLGWNLHNRENSKYYSISGPLSAQKKRRASVGE